MLEAHQTIGSSLLRDYIRRNASDTNNMTATSKLQLPCPNIQLPCPNIQLPCPNIQLPFSSIQTLKLKDQDEHKHCMYNTIQTLIDTERKTGVVNLIQTSNDEPTLTHPQSLNPLPSQVVCDFII